MHRFGETPHHAVHQPRTSLLPGRADGTPQHVIGRGDNALLPEPGAAASQQGSGTVQPQRLAFKELVELVRGRGIEGPQAQVVTDAQLMFGNGLTAPLVGVDHVGGKSQLQGGEAQDLTVDLQRGLPGKTAEDTDEGNLIGEAQSVMRPSPLGNFVPVSFEKAGVADQTGAGDVGIGGRHDVSRRNERLDQSVPEAKHDQFLMSHVQDIMP